MTSLFCTMPRSCLGLLLLEERYGTMCQTNNDNNAFNVLFFLEQLTWHSDEANCRFLREPFHLLCNLNAWARRLSFSKTVSPRGNTCTLPTVAVRPWFPAATFLSAVLWHMWRRYEPVSNTALHSYRGVGMGGSISKYQYIDLIPNGYFLSIYTR